MSNELKLITTRNTTIIARLPELGAFLQFAQTYASSDPASSLTKSRVALEKFLLGLYREKMKKEPSRLMIGAMLDDKSFVATLPRRISVRMNAIRDMSNLGPHVEDVTESDAIQVMGNLIDVLEWYVLHGGTTNHESNDGLIRPSLEILPLLRSRYSQFLRPEIISVQFIQSQERCYLEITTADHCNNYLVDEISKRTDLAFISGGCATDGRLFSPLNSIDENARRFVTDFDVVSIINCTDLFTSDAANRIDDHWRQHGKLLESF